MKTMKTPAQHAADLKKLAPALGMTVTDKISGFKGVIRGVRLVYSGCQHVLIQKPGLDSAGMPIPAQWLDLSGIKNYEKLPATKPPEVLGKKVKDTLTGYVGIVTEYTYLEGSDVMLAIQGNGRDRDGTPSPLHHCDLSYIERLDKKPVQKTKHVGAPAFFRNARQATIR